MKFNKIVCLDHTKLQEWALEELQQLSEQEIEVYNDYPETAEEIISRIGDAEAVLISWQTELSEEIIKQCPSIKYIGMCCSLYDDASANVAVTFAREQGITVKGIRDYGDPGVIEFVISEIIRLLHGFGEHQWKEMPLELTGRKIGIIGLGTTGKMLADCLLPFGADLYYFSRSRKKDYEAKGVKYLPLKELLQQSEILSVHLPKNTKILSKQEFDVFGSGKILINTSLGLPFEESAFEKWIKDPSSFAIFDGDGKKELNEKLLKLTNVISAEKSAGWSAETEKRLSEKVLQNIKK
ncbi:putative 2-hydroxyacid dehydrogenase YoaD [Salinimicrobium marinum]|uniref:2-hydroxyacid dehydrogenase YoaD n=1 Tax=Salinimicrobium marinum TaxID=680283 RepID=A0A918SBS2_9FLAO|nr:NAD(P)-dependent oxidoreductase [Salinimicrobium marinum]GHA34607.1 putative 2-hydroxyacid dehydrogenase YoaD [Salinimicrobium marinum]